MMKSKHENVCVQMIEDYIEHSMKLDASIQRTVKAYPTDKDRFYILVMFTAKRKDKLYSCRAFINDDAFRMSKHPLMNANCEIAMMIDGLMEELERKLQEVDSNERLLQGV